MRYLLIAADKSSQLPIEIPDEISVIKSVSKAKSFTSKSPKKVVKRSSVKSKTTITTKNRTIGYFIARE